MSEKPSYLGLLNALSLAESRAGQYISCWAETTPSEEVRAVLRTVALRETEHGVAFAKRINELGYRVIDKPDPEHEKRMCIAASTEMTDREKAEALNPGGLKAPSNGTPDIFDKFFENKDIDIQTGALLGRYIAEERDTGRLLARCYDTLCAGDETMSCATTNGTTQPKAGDALHELTEQVAEMGKQFAEITKALGATLQRALRD